MGRPMSEGQVHLSGINEGSSTIGLKLPVDSLSEIHCMNAGGKKMLPKVENYSTDSRKTLDKSA